MIKYFHRQGRHLFQWLVTPLSITIIVTSLMIGVTLMQNNWDPLEFLQLGTKYQDSDIRGTEGYDGQFGYYIALNPDPSTVPKQLDVPAYRYQRILLPLMVRFFAFGNDKLIPWLFIIMVFFAHILGVITFIKLLQHWQINHWVGLSYGLFAGFLLSIRLGLSEPLAYCMVVCGIYAYFKEKLLTASIFLLLAAFTKEVTIIFSISLLVTSLLSRDKRPVILLIMVTLFPYILFQLWLWHVFGNPGIASGGAMATSFELIPFGGLFRIGTYSLYYLFMMFIGFAWLIIIPPIWGLWLSVRDLSHKKMDFLTINLLFNSLAILFLPFSTFRETGAILRLSCGLVLAVLLYAGKYNRIKVLRYSYIWLVYNAFLLK